MNVKLPNMLIWLGLVILIAVASPCGAQTSASQSTSAENDYFNAIARADLGQARDIATRTIKSAGAQAGRSDVVLRTWLGRLAIAQLLITDLDAANRAYKAACQYPLKSDPPSLGVECLAGLALTDLLMNGDSDISSRRAKTAAAKSAQQNVRGLPFILAHIAVSIDLLDKDKAAKAEAELDHASHELTAIGANANPSLTALIATLYNKIGESYWVGNQPDNVKRVTTRAVNLHASVVDRTNPDLFMTLFNAATYGSDPETVRQFVLWMSDIAGAESDPKEAQNQFDMLITVMSGVFLKDTYSEILWRWQAHLEKTFGSQSTEAGKNLIALADLMFESARDDEGNALR
jgi:hypothetical protein